MEFGGIPRMFSEECARGVFCWGCGCMDFGSVEVVEIAGVAETRVCGFF